MRNESPAPRPFDAPPPEALLASVSSASGVDRPIGESDRFVRMMGKVYRYAPHDALPVLLEGETGTGKTILARYLHRLSHRANRPFVEVDLGTLDEGVAASELLGHRRGAFTGAVADTHGPFAAAHGGTVFLDELENASAAVQRCLLRVTDEGELRQVGTVRSVRVDVRIVSATNVSLEELIQERRIQRDLAARLSGCLIRVPPLREHAQDIPLLVRHFIACFMGRLGYGTPPVFQSDLMAALTRHTWPDIVRGLSRVVHRLLIDAAPARSIGLEHCEDDLAFLRDVRAPCARPTPGDAQRALEQCGSATRAARQLGVSRATFYRLMRDSGAGPTPVA